MPTGEPAEVHRERAPAKLTRSLRVVGRRDDGYHLLEAEMVSLDLADDLEIRPPGGPAATGAPELELVDEIDWVGGEGTRDRLAGGGASGAPGPVAVPSGPGNLVLKALALVGRSARVRLVKRIPAGAGLGGGSSDAAAVLRWAGVLDPEVAARLGADVPFCLAGGHAIARGIGERLEPLEPLEAAYLLVTPAFGVSTTAVYRAHDELGRKSRRDGPNDLEPAALVVEPALAAWRDRLAEVAGRRPTLAGSGSTWFVEGTPERTARWRRELLELLAGTGARAAVTCCRTVGGSGP